MAALRRAYLLLIEIQNERRKIEFSRENYAPVWCLTKKISFESCTSALCQLFTVAIDSQNDSKIYLDLSLSQREFPLMSNATNAFSLRNGFRIKVNFEIL